MTVFAFFEKKKTETHFSEENENMAIRFLRAGWIELGLEQQIEAYKKLKCFGKRCVAQRYLAPSSPGFDSSIPPKKFWNFFMLLGFIDGAA